jgi:CheY-like chemotaxis protein
VGILVVEDDPTLREAFELVFREMGYEVFTAANGEQALEHIRLQRPTFMFIDLVMPVMSGFRLIETLQTDASLADIPMVAMTACWGPAPAGVRVMRKPFATDTALELVRLHCGDPPRPLGSITSH